MARSTAKRTTVMLGDAEVQALATLAEIQGTSDMESIRRALRVAEMLAATTRDGGRVQLHRADGSIDTLVFM